MTKHKFLTLLFAIAFMVGSSSLAIAGSCGSCCPSDAGEKASSDTVEAKN